MTPLVRIRSVAAATVQDGGRDGWSHVGVATSGAWHGERYRLAAALVGGGATTPTIEVLGGVLELEALHDVVVAVIGSQGASVDGERAPVGAAFAVGAGSTVTVQPAHRGPAYVAVAGWIAQPVLGSCATDTFAGLGPRPLASGVVLSGTADGHASLVGTFHRRGADATGPVRVIPAADAVGLDGRWAVTQVARSGVRLRPLHPVPTVAADQPSRAVLPGTVQWTPGGEAIVLGPDGAVTGGYPVLGVVATVDLDRVSMLSESDVVVLRSAGVDECAAAFRAARRRRVSAVAHPDHLHTGL